MKDISKLFETIMDFKGLSCLVTEKSLIKNQRPVFFLPLLLTTLAFINHYLLRFLRKFHKMISLISLILEIQDIAVRW